MNPRGIILLLLLLAPVFFGSGCAALSESHTLENGAETAQAPEEDFDYRVNPKDNLQIKVYPDESLSGEFVVTRQGTISFPLLGEVQVQGLSLHAVERKLTALLQKDYLVYPQVHATVKTYHAMTISVLGEVNKPGPYELSSEEGATTLLEVIAKAGGFTNVANIKKIKIIRMENGEKKVYKVNGEDIVKGKTKDITLRANDIIIVEQSWF